MRLLSLVEVCLCLLVAANHALGLQTYTKISRTSGRGRQKTEKTVVTKTKTTRRYLHFHQTPPHDVVFRADGVSVLFKSQAGFIEQGICIP